MNHIHVSVRPAARYALLWLMVIALLTTAWPAVAQDPDDPDGEQPTPMASSPPSSRRAASPTAPRNPNAVLWDQPLSTVNQDTYANQDFVDPANDGYDIFIADDFINADPWLIETIFIPGNTWNNGCDLTCANTLHWQIYADASGVPDGDPYGGGNPPIWSLSLSPTDPQVTLSPGIDGWLSNVTLSLASSISLPPGTWWLVFYPTMEFIPCAQYGRHMADTTNGHVAQVINPGGAFGFPTTWAPVTASSTWGSTQQDLAFRLEGIPIYVDPRYDGYIADDDNNGNSSGNDDGIVNPAEIIELYVILRNHGSDTATGVNATISTTDTHVTWLYNTASSYPDIPGGGTGTNSNDFDFEVDPSTPDGHVIHFDLDITASNGGPWSDGFDITVVGGVGGGNVALISDQTELQAITSILDSMGLPYDVVNNNWDGTQGLYTSDYNFLSNYLGRLEAVVWYASGYGVGRLITQQEHDALEQFLQAGGQLLVTGYDTLGHPTDSLLADLVRSSSSGDGPFTYNYTAINGNHPIANGPYGSFPAGTPLTAGHSDHDQAEADVGRGATTVAELVGGRDKIMATELPSGGIVVYWNGNYNTYDWVPTYTILREEDIEDKREAEGGAIDSLPRSPTVSVQPGGVFAVDGILSDTPPPAPTPAQAELGTPAGPIPQAATVIDFDNASQPCLFVDTVALRDEYQAMGVLFDGPGGNDGGAILNECGNFGVSGHSPPNFLAFNASATLADGGVPRDPEEIAFVNPVSFVEINAGSYADSGQPVTMEAFDASGNSLGSDTITLDQWLQPLSVSASGIARVVISSPASIFVLDDLTFDTGGSGNPNEAMLKNTLHWLTGGDPHEPNESPADCTPIFFDDPIVYPTIDPPGDWDYYCFQGSGGQTIRADIDAWVDGSPLDSVLTLFDSDGTTVLVQNDDYDGLDSRVEYTLAHDGTFYLRVRDYYHPSRGGPDYTYSILLEGTMPPSPFPFFDDMESGTNGWSADGLWHQVEDGVSPYPNSHSPTHSWWYGQDSSGNYNTGAPNSGNLTSPPIAIPPGAQATLSFWQWYETEPGLLPQSIYFDVHHDSDGDDNISGGIYTDWADDLIDQGYSVTEYNQPIDLATLSGHQVLALFDPEIALTAAEIAAVNAFMQDGGRVIALGEWGDLHGTNTVLNALSAAHGVTFNTDVVLDNTDNDGDNDWPLIYNFADHPLVQGINTVVLYAGCSLSLGGPAVPLATGDNDTTVAIPTGGATTGVYEDESSGDQFAQPQAIIPGAPVVIAHAPVGDGELIAIGDSNLWTDGDPDSDGVISLDEYSNAALSRQIFGKEADSPYWDQKWVQISVDDGPFQDLLQVTGGPMNAWHQANVDLSPYEDSIVRICYHFDTVDTFYNYYRGWYIDDVDIGPGYGVGPVHYHDYDVDDDNNDNSSGDGDGIPEPGETIELDVELINDGADTATSVRACISESSPHVDGFLYNTCSDYGDIPGGGTAVNWDDFDLTIDPAAPTGHIMHFDLNITADNGGPWSDSFEIPVGESTVGPLIYISAIIDDDNNGESVGNGDGEINPGETIELDVEVGNAGNATASSVSGCISEYSPYVDGFLYNTCSSYGSIPGGGMAVNYSDFDFEVDSAAPHGHLVHFCMDFSAANGGPWNFCFDIPVEGIPCTALHVEPPDQEVCLTGGAFHVDIAVEEVIHLGAFQFDLAYDPAIVRIDGPDDVDLGPFLGSTGCNVMEVGPIIDDAAGRLTYGANIIGACNGPSGDGVAATVTLHPENVGDSDLILENAQLLNTDDPPAPITPVTPYPGHVTVMNCFFADVDRDGHVDIVDVYNVAYRWGCHCGDPCYDPIYDLNNDCAIDISDIQIVACYFGWPNGDFSGCYLPTASSMAPLADQPSTLRLTPAETHVQPGESFTVDLVVEETHDLAGFEALLHYDPRVLRFDGLALGDFLASTGNAAEPREAHADTEAGTVTLGGFSFGAHDSPDGSGTLVTLTFTVQGLGASPLTLSDVQLARRCGLAQPAPTIVGGRVFGGQSLYLPLVYK